MCGIFGILSSAVEPPHSSAEGCLAELNRLLAFRSGGLAGPEVLEKAFQTLQSVRQESYRFVGRGGFLAVMFQAALRDRLASACRALRDWTRALEDDAERPARLSQRERELLNGLIVGGKDLVWQIEKDVLQNIEPVRRLLGEEDLCPAVLSHGWQLNLVLNSLDRLEVRGRDSAGVALYVRFPDGRSLDSFLSAPAAPRGPRRRGEDLAGRSALPAFGHGAVVRPDSSDRTLLFAWKVAEEVGEMGQNVRFLRESIAHDALFQAALRQEGVEVQALAHTRWASNGIVSLPNCHPVDSTLSLSGAPVRGSRGSVVAVLNGDVDNYQELFRRYIREPGFAIDEEITTDAKIIPLVVGHHYRQGRSLEEAFRAAFDEFEGSMAIGIMAADRPGEFLFGQKGSGQGLFLGFAGNTVAIASEMYGLVELTQDYLKAEGEKSPRGELFRLRAVSDRVEVKLLERGEETELPPARLKKAEITTRDIDRGEFPRFLLKEISESVESVRKTLRGKLESDGQGPPRFYLGQEVLDPVRVAALKRGTIRRILAIGQGTAAIAGSGIAHLLQRALAGARPAPEIASCKATELSGHGLRDDMSDTLVIAVSQSGTTTDTNRTVDLVRERGAWVIAIVNRRNSDLVYKSHGVLYTSDGRDIEMSVASTKAFYAQNVAGQVLALALAEALEALPPAELATEVKALLELPAAMQAALALSPAVGELADRWALRRIYWAVVGSGAGKIAADEVRIKLSELCYKSIASDFLEDKKHIDLSSEPLVLVCANGIPPATASDVVKEVAIFKAHRSVPLVIADEGETRFDPYAAGVLAVPRYTGSLGYLLATMMGHLFGYHAAASFDRAANSLRAIRTGIVRVLQGRTGSPEEGAGLFDPAAMPAELVADIARVQDGLAEGAFDSGLRPGTAARLSTLFQFILGRLSPDLFARQFDVPASRENLIQAMVQTLTAAIGELGRPIDAIKHQAKTVTVGVSRLEEERQEGSLWSLIRTFGLPQDLLAPSHRAFLGAFEPLVAHVEGATLYRVGGLDAVGRPRPESAICVQKKLGCAAGILSRSEDERPLTGTKWGVVKTRELHLGYGQNDGRKILIVPFIGERSEGWLLLCHLELLPTGDRAARLRALAAHRSHLDRLKIAVTERNQTWDGALIDRLDNDTLFLRTPEQAAEEMVSRIGAA